MFIEAAQQIILALLIEIDFFAESKIHSAFEVLLHQEERFIRVGCGTKRSNGRIAVLTADGFEFFVNLRNQIVNQLLFTIHAGMTQAGPSLHRVKAEPAFITKPALVDIHITAAHGSVDLAVASRIARNPTANGSGRVIDAKIASRAAASANRSRAFKKPHADFESKICAG